MEFLPLHEHKEHMAACADILNEEWPRSKTARLHSLEKSNKELPFCIVMVTHENGAKPEVIGHSRLCKVQGDSKACFVESVILKKSNRGKGDGRKIMNGTEDMAKKLGYNTLYLTTHDKQDFYKHVGYEYCTPIVSLGNASTLLNNKQVGRLFEKLGETSKETICSSFKKAEQTSAVSVKGPNIGPISSAPVPALPPPPPPPPPPSMKPTASLQATRMDPNKIYWMKKTL